MSDGKENSGSDIHRETPIILSELFFVLLPFLVIVIIQLSKLDSNALIYTHLWGLAATILFGQTIFKLTLGVASYEKEMDWRKFGLFIAMLIVFGLIPSVIVMTLFTINSSQNVWLVILQLVLFILSITCFYSLGALGKYLSSNAFLRRISRVLDMENIN